MRLDLFAIGALSLLAQVVLLRELNVASFGSELIYLLALGAWLLGTAGGALAGGRGAAPGSAAKPEPDAGRPIRRLFAVAAAAILLGVVWARGARPALGAVPGAYLAFGQQILALAVATLPAAFVFGRLFRLAARAAAARGGTLAGAYALESAGALAGGAAATLLVRAGLANLTGAWLCALAALALTRPRRGGRAMLAIAAVAGLALLPSLDRSTTAWTHSGLLETRDSPYGRVTLTRWGEQLNVFQNDALAYETGGTAAEEFVTPAALQHPDPERILVLGGGAAGLVGEAMRQRPLVLDSVELDSVLQAMLVRHLPPDLRAPLEAPGVRLFLADPRRFVAASRGGYDLMLLGMPEPSSGQANRYYTREFFAECAARLDSAGVLALRLPAAENLWAPALTRRMASIDGALRAAFAQVLWLPGAASVVLASRAPLTRDADTLAARLAQRGLRPRLVTPEYLRYLVTNDRVAEIAARLAGARVPANRDARPVCYQYTLILWLAKFYPAVAWAAAPRLPAGAWWGLAAAGALLAVMVRRWTRGRALRRALVVGLAGAIGMVGESLLLLVYQSRHGVLYQDLGLLLMAFMAGLAAGAFAVDLMRHRPVDARGASAAVLLAALTVLAGALGLALETGADFGLAQTGFWLFAFGALTGAVFARLSAEAGDQAAAAGPLYGADLAGGCVGALAASLLLIPLVGFVGTAVVLGGVALLALLWI